MGLYNWRFVAFIFALILLILGCIIKATEWLNNMPKKKNGYWSKIEIISLKFQFNEILKIYDIGGFTYSLDVYEKFQLSIAENELKSFLEKSTWDGSKDVIELYLVEFKDNDSKIVVLFSPIELYANDEVCGILDTSDLVTDISKEQIFPESKIIQSEPGF